MTRMGSKARKVFRSQERAAFRVDDLAIIERALPENAVSGGRYGDQDMAMVNG